MIYSKHIKKLIVMPLICCAFICIAQRGRHAPENETKWLSGTIAMNNGTARNLDIDTNMLSAGFKALHIMLVSADPDNFKFVRDKFDIPVLDDFQVKYEVKGSMAGRGTTFTLYIYSGSLIIYKRNYSIMFDSRMNRTLILQSQ